MFQAQADLSKIEFLPAGGAFRFLVVLPALFSAFVDGYGAAGRAIIGSPLFTLYEVLWLLRVFNFERSKEEQGLSRAPGYPEAAFYEQMLARILQKMQ